MGGTNSGARGRGITGERPIVLGAGGGDSTMPPDSRNQVGAAADRVAAATCTGDDDVAQPASTVSATMGSAAQRRRRPSVIAVLSGVRGTRKGRQLPYRTQPEAGRRTAMPRVTAARAARPSSSTGYEVQCANPASTTGAAKPR